MRLRKKNYSGTAHWHRVTGARRRTPALARRLRAVRHHRPRAPQRVALEEQLLEPDATVAFAKSISSANSAAASPERSVGNFILMKSYFKKWGPPIRDPAPNFLIRLI